jgi:hypothetical protein
VERRRESRIQTESYVRVTVLADPPGNPIIGRILDLSGRGLSVTLAQSLPVGSLVRIDQPGLLLLGEVAYCQAENDVFRIGVQVDQALRQTADLELLRRAIHGHSDAKEGKEADVTIKVSPAWTQNQST